MQPKQKRALSPDAGLDIPSTAAFTKEVGATGLKKTSGRILEETKAAFCYPRFIRTVAEMRNNPTVGSALNVYRMLMTRISWDVAPPKGASRKELARADAIRSMMTDMTHSWGDFIQSVVPYLEYGYSLNEIVLKRRLHKDGSAYNDGLIGIKKLPSRSPTTVSRWVYSEDGTELVGVEQTLMGWDAGVSSAVASRYPGGRIPIPIKKLIHISASPVNGNPEGNSIYKNIYLAFKQLELLQDQQLIGVSKDVQGMLKIELPPKYFSPNASPAEKETLRRFEEIIDNYNAGNQRGLLVPAAADPETKLPLFSYELMEKKGTPSYDLEKAIKRLQSDILSALSVDILKLGSEGSGSFSLAESKSSVLAMAIDSRMREICDALNSQLIPLIYEMNGWSMERPAQFVYGDVDEISLEEYSKAVQRIFAVSAIEMDRDVMNAVRRALRVPVLPDSEPVDEEKLPANITAQTSRSGDGMAVGTSGNGTSTSPSQIDPATGNKNK